MVDLTLGEDHDDDGNDDNDGNDDDKSWRQMEKMKRFYEEEAGAGVGASHGGVGASRGGVVVAGEASGGVYRGDGVYNEAVVLEGTGVRGATGAQEGIGVRGAAGGFVVDGVHDRKEASKGVADQQRQERRPFEGHFGRKRDEEDQERTQRK